MAYRVVCGECRQLVLSTERIGDPEAEVLAEHLQTEHPGVLSSDRPVTFAGVLHYYDVQRDSE